jgi:hypothetical protein
MLTLLIEPVCATPAATPDVATTTLLSPTSEDSTPASELISGSFDNQIAVIAESSEPSTIPAIDQDSFNKKHPASFSALPELNQAKNSSFMANEVEFANVAQVAIDAPPTTQSIPDLQEPPSQQASDLVGTPLIHVQGAYVLQGDESSARARVTGLYAVSPNVLFGATVDLTTGNVFSDSRQEGLNLNELYVAVSPESLPGLRFVAGLMDLTSYFDRNSFAKDSTTHFFNPAFQTNPALAATGIGSRPGALVNWSVNDNIEIKAATFSSSRNLDSFALDAFAGEVGVRLGNAIIRGTYVTDRDAGANDGFQEIFQIPRGNGDFGLSSGDREEAYGLNAELFIPQLNLGLFGRYGWYNNQEVDRSATTYSLGFNLLDLFLPSDRLGLAYGRQLSNDRLRRDSNDKIPDVLELFYDVRLASNIRAGVTVQERNEFSETVLGFRIRADFDVTGFGRGF